MKEKVSMWEILIPTVKPNSDGKKFFTTKYHKVWDSRVREITHGLTIMTPAKGQWVSPHGKLFEERMIPVRIVATKEQMDNIMDMTLVYYSQEAILCYKVSDEVIFRYGNIVNHS